MRLDGDPSLAFETEQRLAYRDAAKPKSFGDGVLGNAVTFTKDAVENEPSDVERRLLAAAAAIMWIDGSG
jgi:hypothetical protein